jgi:hypothetical protein
MLNKSEGAMVDVGRQEEEISEVDVDKKRKRLHT